MRSSRRVVLSHEAEDDLRQIAAYTVEHWGEDHADRYINSIVAHIQSLGSFPERGAVYQALPNVRWTQIRSYNVFYVAQKHELRILRIIHQRRNVIVEIENVEEPTGNDQ